MTKSFWTVRIIASSAMIAAVYVAITGIFAPISFGYIQIRISEALVTFALFTPAAIPGLTAGCLISNILWSPFGILDVVFGTIATFLGVFFTYFMRKNNRIIALTPPVISNALLVPAVLAIVDKQSYIAALFTVALSQAIACYGIGYSLSLIGQRIFKEKESRPSVR